MLERKIDFKIEENIDFNILSAIVWKCIFQLFYAFFAIFGFLYVLFDFSMLLHFNYISHAIISSSSNSNKLLVT